MPGPTKFRMTDRALRNNKGKRSVDGSLRLLTLIALANDVFNT